MILALEDFGLTDVLIHRLKPFLNVFVLILIEILQLLRFVGFFIECDWTIAISFPRGIGTYKIDLAIALQLPRELVWVVVDRIARRLVLDIRGCIGGMARHRVTLGSGRLEGGARSSLGGFVRCGPGCRSSSGL